MLAAEQLDSLIQQKEQLTDLNRTAVLVGEEWMEEAHKADEEAEIARTQASRLRQLLQRSTETGKLAHSPGMHCGCWSRGVVACEVEWYRVAWWYVRWLMEW